MNYDNFIKNNCGDITIIYEDKDDMEITYLVNLSEYNAAINITIHLNQGDDENLLLKKTIAFIPLIRNLIKMRGYNNGKCNVKYGMAYIKWFPNQIYINKPCTYVIAYLGNNPTSLSCVAKIEMFDHDLKF